MQRNLQNRSQATPTAAVGVCDACKGTKVIPPGSKDGKRCLKCRGTGQATKGTLTK